MRVGTRLAFLIWITVCLVFYAAPTWAGDCSGPDDCKSIPDNGTKAACVGGVIAGYCIYTRTRKRKKEDDPEFGEGRADDESMILGESGGDSGGAPQPAAPDPGEHTSTDTSPTDTKAPDILNRPSGGDDLF
jgi:hypothetical protein